MDKDKYCRLCGSDVTNVTTLHRPCPKTRYERDIYASLGFDVSTDDSHYSDFVCFFIINKIVL